MVETEYNSISLLTCFTGAGMHSYGYRNLSKSLRWTKWQKHSSIKGLPCWRTKQPVDIRARWPVFFKDLAQWLHPVLPIYWNKTPLMKLHCPVRATKEQQAKNQVIFWNTLNKIDEDTILWIYLHFTKCKNTLKTANETSQMQNISIIYFLCRLFPACWWLSFNTPHRPPKENDFNGMCVSTMGEASLFSGVLQQP